MASTSARKRSPFTYIWTIENFSNFSYIHLKSPPFYVHSVSKVPWRICIEEFLELCCWIESKDDRKEGSYEIDVEYSLLDADGSPIISKKDDLGSFFVFMLSREDFFERRSEFVTNNTLTLQFQMWQRGREIASADFCYGRTRLKTFTESFLWPISEFSALRSSSAEDSTKLASDERKLNSLKRYFPERHFAALVLYLKKNFKSDEVCIGFGIEKNQDCGYCCEISVLDANGKVIASSVERIRSYYKEIILKVAKLISKSKLNTNKNLFLPNDTLMLKCSFDIYAGIISSEIEYYTSNVSIVSKDKEDVLDNAKVADGAFQLLEYQFPGENNSIDDHSEVRNDSGSCNNSCFLTAALRSLQSEALLSDITLKIGENLYSVHKNILGSRSPIFERRFNNDVQDSIIEINDMEESTLRRLLLYVYTDAVRDIQYKEALGLYRAAVNYQLLDLQDKCSDILIANLSKSNVSEIRFLADKYQDKKLQTTTTDFDVIKDIKINNKSYFDSSAIKESKIFNKSDFEFGSTKDLNIDDEPDFKSVAGKAIKKDENLNVSFVSKKDIMIYGNRKRWINCNLI